MASSYGFLREDVGDDVGGGCSCRLQGAQAVQSWVELLIDSTVFYKPCWKVRDEGGFISHLPLVTNLIFFIAKQKCLFQRCSGMMYLILQADGWIITNKKWRSGKQCRLRQSCVEVTCCGWMFLNLSFPGSGRTKDDLQSVSRSAVSTSIN